MLIKLPTICVIWMVIGIFAQNKTESQKVPSEVKRTVDALVGHWNFQGTDIEPGVKESQRVTMNIDCKLVALGAAVVCTLSGSLEGAGPIEAATIVGYNPNEQIVHWMEISSTGEYHDHHGKWKGDTLAFEPLLYISSGKKRTENFMIRFPSTDKFMLKSVTETAGGVSTINGTAHRA